jgi:hypothetical protein
MRTFIYLDGIFRSDDDDDGQLTETYSQDRNKNIVVFD